MAWFLPVVIALFLVADALARSLPIDGLCFQAWECMTRYQEPGSIFEANRQFRSARTHGNMANMGNLPGERVYRPQVFTTDSRGFRNDPAVGRGAVDTVVVGDSFAAGYGISDDDTLPVQLTGRTGRTFYNAGGPYAYLDTARTLKRTLGIDRGSVIILWTESEPVELLKAAEAQARHATLPERMLSQGFGSSAGRIREALRGWWLTSPLKVVAQKAFLAVSNDRVLPNVYAHLVTQRRLQNGASMLFLPTDVGPFHQHRSIQPAADHLRWLAAGIRDAGMRPLVVLVPHKYSVYYPLLDGVQPAAGDAVHPLAQLAAALRSDGIEAMDLTPLFQARAREALREQRYLYWRDDTHWDRLGVDVAADAIRAEWYAEGRPIR